MIYKVSRKKASVAASEFVKRYRDPERMAAMCGECPSFGKLWGCPPHDFNVASVSDGYATVELMATIIEFDEQTRAACTSPEQAVEVGRQAMDEVWQSLLPRMYEMERAVPGSRCFTFRCVLCPEGCTRPEGKPCRHPDKMRHSLESVGFDITAAATDLLGINLDWSGDGSLSKTITLLTALMCP